MLRLAPARVLLSAAISLANLPADDLEALLFGLVQAGIDFALQEGLLAEELSPAFEAQRISQAAASRVELIDLTDAPSARMPVLLALSAAC